MRLISLITLLQLCIWAQESNAAIPAASNKYFQADLPGPLLRQKKGFTEIKIRGKKITLKEKIIFKLLKLKAKRLHKKNKYFAGDPDKQANISFISGSATLVLLILGFVNIITGGIFLIIIPLIAGLAFWQGIKSTKSGKNFKNLFGIITGGLVLILGIIFSIMALTAF